MDVDMDGAGGDFCRLSHFFSFLFLHTFLLRFYPREMKRKHFARSICILAVRFVSHFHPAASQINSNVMWLKNYWGLLCGCI